jgi:class 3 adenylate cyclase
MAEAATAASAVAEASDTIACAALDAGATATFAVPLLRSELVDRLVDALAARALASEAEASSALLKRVLPQRVTDRLKTGVSFYAEAMPSVSILFCDVCQFTVIASVLEPLQIIILLNELFSAFDALMLKYGVFKVESAFQHLS